MEEKINEKEFKIVICGGGSTYTAGIVKIFGRGRIKNQRIMVI